MLELPFYRGNTTVSGIILYMRIELKIFLVTKWPHDLQAQLSLVAEEFLRKERIKYISFVTALILFYADSDLQFIHVQCNLYFEISEIQRTVSFHAV